MVDKITTQSHWMKKIINILDVVVGVGSIDWRVYDDTYYANFMPAFYDINFVHKIWGEGMVWEMCLASVDKNLISKTTRIEDPKYWCEISTLIQTAHTPHRARRRIFISYSQCRNR